MRHTHIFAACTLIALLGYSECTGGLFSIPITLATQESVLNPSHGIPMTFAEVEGFTCLSLLENHNQETLLKESDQGEKGCADGQSCLAQAHEYGTEKLALLEGNVPSPEFLPAILALFIQRDFIQHHLQHTAREGPLFEKSPLFAHVLVKRE